MKSKSNTHSLHLKQSIDDEALLGMVLFTLVLAIVNAVM
jgi:hypothetical protein